MLALRKINLNIKTYILSYLVSPGADNHGKLTLRVFDIALTVKGFRR